MTLRLRKCTTISVFSWFLWWHSGKSDRTSATALLSNAAVIPNEHDLLSACSAACFAFTVMWKNVGSLVILLILLPENGSFEITLLIKTCSRKHSFTCQKLDLGKYWVSFCLVLLVWKSWALNDSQDTLAPGRAVPFINLCGAWWFQLAKIYANCCLLLYYTFQAKWLCKPWSLLWASNSSVSEALM